MKHFKVKKTELSPEFIISEDALTSSQASGANLIVVSEVNELVMTPEEGTSRLVRTPIN